MRTTVLALLAGTLLLAGCGGGSETGRTTTAPLPPATETGPPATTTTPSPELTTAATTTETLPPEPSAKTIAITVKGGKSVGGIERVTVEKPELVELVVHSDVADEIHLHGYDLRADVEAGGTARIRFQAKITGVFEAELEKRGLQILELTVK